MSEAADAYLNVDVLLNIMAMSDNTTICRLMRSSRELYHEGPKYILRRGVRLKKVSSVSSFVMFMKAEQPHRFQSLRRLHISTGCLPPSDARALEQLLIDNESHFEIRRLTIDHAEEFFDSTPGLVGAFALVHTVTELTMSEIGRRASLFLERSRSKLISANLSMVMRPLPADSEDSDDEDYDDDAFDSTIRNPILQLHNSQDTLRKLSVEWADTDCDLGVLYKECYPNVKTLTLASNELPYTMHYARAYPNLSELTLDVATRELAELGRGIDSFVDHRYVNKLEQMQHGKWERLTAVHGTLIDHFLLGLLCEVEQVHINGNFMDKRMFRSVLSTTRPKYVNFQGFDVDLFFEGEFRRLMRGPLLAPVRCFEIMIFFGGMLQPEEVDVPKALDALIQGISQTSITSFGVTLCCFGLQAELGARKPKGEVDLCPAEQYLQDLNFDELAIRIREAVPTLKTVTISLIGHSTRDNGFGVYGDDVDYKPDAVESLPLWHAATITHFKIPSFLNKLPFF
ncbi:hypothetical protein C8Q70DRAFT_923853 [Cubamyces menziesii]|uniref:Uncharacterized protein n=1 Tax=Trametes cubensis TaxID=1111947 RepID=A0AAD7X833_9APHY|nr:hypothetical protein C8Q70DRAFT_923853 [Cubamyces menziesii]KAJ8469388.1 hypothetical protein ONZ51_g9022 [Trametes cubensis]